MKRITINYNKRCADEPDKGHNRWHPKIPAVVEAAPGEEVVMETRDAFDGQLKQTSSKKDVAALDLNLVHPLTGPVYVTGAKEGDLLEVDILRVEPDRWGYTLIVPGFGFLRDLFTEPFIVKWVINKGYAQTPDLPGVRIPGSPFVGTIGVLPSEALAREWREREQTLLQKGGFVLPPEPKGAVPSGEPFSSEGLRTIPPRENGGNLDIKQLSAGARLYIPVFAEGAMFSAGDAHFAQGDGETCGTAIEMNATLHVKFKIHRARAKKQNIRFPFFERDTYYGKPEFIAPKRFLATTGMCLHNGINESENATLSARHAVLNMIDRLMERGWTKQQAYIITSVAADLRISELVDVPNFVVSAILPLSIFIK